MQYDNNETQHDGDELDKHITCNRLKYMKIFVI